MKTLITTLIVLSGLQLSAQDSLKITYKAVVRVQAYPKENVMALTPGKANGLILTCPALDADPNMKSLHYDYRVHSGVIKLDTRHPGVIWVYPNKKVDHVEIEIYVEFPQDTVYFPVALDKNQPLYNREGFVIPSNVRWEERTFKKGQYGHYLLATETFAVK